MLIIFIFAPFLELEKVILSNSMKKDNFRTMN